MTPIDREKMDALSQQAAASKRLRAHLNLHSTSEEAVQRLMIAMEPGTFVPVHCHEQTWKWELLMILRGEVECVIFDEAGQVLSRGTLTPGGELTAVELPPGTWHSVISKAPGTVIFEVKPGPFDPDEAARFAPWCPGEADSGKDQFQQWLAIAPVGSVWESD